MRLESFHSIDYLVNFWYERACPSRSVCVYACLLLNFIRRHQFYLCDFFRAILEGYLIICFFVCSLLNFPLALLRDCPNFGDFEFIDEIGFCWCYLRHKQAPSHLTQMPRPRQKFKTWFNQSTRFLGLTQLRMATVCCSLSLPSKQSCKFVE